jgi:hypothetical protein
LAGEAAADDIDSPEVSQPLSGDFMNVVDPFDLRPVGFEHAACVIFDFGLQHRGCACTFERKVESADAGEKRSHSQAAHRSHGSVYSK